MLFLPPAVASCLPVGYLGEVGRDRFKLFLLHSIMCPREAGLSPSWKMRQILIWISFQQLLVLIGSGKEAGRAAQAWLPLAGSRAHLSASLSKDMLSSADRLRWRRLSIWA
jgi:hypothetical protein